MFQPLSGRRFQGHSPEGSFEAANYNSLPGPQMLRGHPPAPRRLGMSMRPCPRKGPYRISGEAEHPAEPRGWRQKLRVAAWASLRANFAPTLRASPCRKTGRATKKERETNRAASDCVRFHTDFPWWEATAENALPAVPRPRGRSCRQDQVFLGTLPAGLAGHPSPTCLEGPLVVAADLGHRN